MQKMSELTDYYYIYQTIQTFFTEHRQCRAVLLHDEILIEAPIEEIDAASQILKESMIDAGTAHLKNVPVVAEVSVADNWYEK